MEADYSEEIDLQKYWWVLKRRALPAIVVFGIIFALITVAALIKKPTYEASGKLLVKTNRAATLTGLGEGIGQLEALANQNSPLDTQVEVIYSIPVLQDVITSLNLKDSAGDPVKPDQLAENLKVKGLAGTDVIRISYQSRDPETAAAVVNRLIEVYIRTNIQANRAEAASARQFIEEQLPSSEAAVEAAALNLRQFKEQNRVIVLQEEAVAAVNLISELDSQITQTQAQLADTVAQTNTLRQQLRLDPQQAITVAALSQSPGVQEVFTQLQETQTQLTVEQTRYQPGHPTIASLQRRIAALNTLLQQRVDQTLGQHEAIASDRLQIGEIRQNLILDLVRADSTQRGLQQRIATLINTQIAYKERARSIPRLEQTQQELERRLQAAQTTYEILLTRLQEVRVAENQNIGNARIISPSLVPDTPIDSRKKLIIAAGGVVGVLMGIGTVFLLDLIDRSVKTVKQAKELFGYTLLGVIPAFKSAKHHPHPGSLCQAVPRVIERDFPPRTAIAEAYQMLQANLKFLSSDTPLKTIVITSSVASEGKSEVSANLAVAIAQVGRKVLLVDANLRHPAQHHVWGLTNVVGLSNLLVEQLTMAATQQEVMPNLWVIPAGVIPPNPLALLDSRRMASLVELVSQDYDFVIFDTPPLAGTADAAILGKLVGGTVLVVRPGVTDSASANAAKEFLNQSGQQVLGMVINGVNIKNEPDSYFYYTKDTLRHDSRLGVRYSRHESHG